MESGQVRDVLHRVADLIADLLEERARSNPVAAGPDRRECPKRPAASPRRRAPRMPPKVEHRLDVTADNHDRARLALLRRGYALPPKE
jgi:hypothetical protein